MVGVKAEVAFHQTVEEEAKQDYEAELHNRV
jgi:hypothetical protein